MKTKLACFSLLLLISAQAVWASQTAMIGGTRNAGYTLGMETSRDFGPATGRFGIEATTGEDVNIYGDNPFLLFAGLQLPVPLVRQPVSWSFGFVGNYGNRTELGEYLSLVFDKLYQADKMYLETGLDWFGDHGHALFQLGYRFGY